MKHYIDRVIDTAEKWLVNPVSTDIPTALNQSDGMLNSLQSLMQEEHADKKTVGSLIGRIKGVQKALNSLEKVNWVKVGEGYLSIGHRPSSKLVGDLKLQGSTHILTLLSEHEGAKKIQTLADKNQLNWLWFPMESAKPPKEERYQELTSIFSEIKNILDNHGRIYVHCSAGIHRTGMITFCFLRFAGYTEHEARLVLEKLRPETSKGVGGERVKWANEVVDSLA